MEEADKQRADFELAYNELLEPIFRFLCVRLGDRERAQELAQETFMRTWLYLAKGNTIAALKPFLFTTAYNLFKNEIRGKKKALSLDLLMDDEAYEPSTVTRSAEDESEIRLLLEQVEKLAPLYREVITMRYVDDLPVQTIALLLKKNPLSVSVLIHRAQKKLRSLYTP